MYTLKSLFILLGLFFLAIPMSRALQITLPSTTYSCGEQEIQVTAGCAFSGQLSVTTLLPNSGVEIENVSPVVAGLCTLTVSIEPGVTAQVVLVFEIEESDDPSGCALVGQTAEATLNTDCSCNLSVQVNISHESCFSCGNGEAVVSVTSGFNPEFNWSTGEMTSGIQNLIPGQYQVTISDGGLCQVIENVVITPYVCPGFSLVYAQENNVCHGDTSGVVSIEGLSNQSNDFVLLWENGSTDSSREGLIAGNYFLTVTDGDFCVEMFEFSLTQPAAIEMQSLLSEGNDNFGSRGYIQASAVGGTGALTYSLYAGNQWLSENTGGNFDSLQVGCYKIELSDSVGCTASFDSICLAIHCLAFEIYAQVQHESCGGFHDGKITIDSTGAFGFPIEYEWSTGQFGSMIDSLDPGSYSITIQDSFGCQVLKSWTLTGVDLLTIQTDQIIHSTGQDDGEIIVISNGGHGGNTFQVFRDSMVLYSTTGHFKNLNPGCYQIQVSDSLGCQSEVISVCVELKSSNNNWQENATSLYPNPASSLLNISGLESENAEICILDPMGNVQKKRADNGSVEIQDLKPGLYFIRFIKNGQIICLPFVKI